MIVPRRRIGVIKTQANRAEVVNAWPLAIVPVSKSFPVWNLKYKYLLHERTTSPKLGKLKSEAVSPFSNCTWLMCNLSVPAVVPVTLDHINIATLVVELVSIVAVTEYLANEVVTFKSAGVFS